MIHAIIISIIISILVLSNLIALYFISKYYRRGSKLEKENSEAILAIEYAEYALLQSGERIKSLHDQIELLKLKNNQLLEKLNSINSQMKQVSALLNKE